MELTEIQEKINNDEAFRSELFAAVEPTFLQALQTKGFVVRTKEEEDQYLQNYEQNAITPKVEQLYKAKIGEEVKKIHNQYDEDLFQLTGLRKDANQKTYEFMKQVWDGRLDETTKIFKEQVTQLSSQNQQLKNELEAVKSESQQKYTQFKVNSSLDAELNNKIIAVPPTITDEESKNRYIAEQKEMIKNRLLTNYKYSDTSNGLVFLKEDGTAVLNPKNAQPASVADLLQMNFSYYFVENQKSGGLGVNQGGNNTELTNKDLELATIKSITDVNIKRAKFNEYSVKNNLTIGSPDWSKAYKSVF